MADVDPSMGSFVKYFECVKQIEVLSLSDRNLCGFKFILKLNLLMQDVDHVRVNIVSLRGVIHGRLMASSVISIL